MRSYLPMYRYSGTCKTEKNVFLWEKNIPIPYILFSVNCLTSDFSELFFYSSIRIRIRTFFGYGFGPAKTFGFVLIRIHNTFTKCHIKTQFFPFKKFGNKLIFKWFCLDQDPN
jgi:hypothetical protein